jgi:hypothetical protein
MDRTMFFIFGLSKQKKIETVLGTQKTLLFETRFFLSLRSLKMI